MKKLFQEFLRPILTWSIFSCIRGYEREKFPKIAAFVLAGGITTYQSMTNFNAGNFPLAWVKKTQDMLPELQKLVESWEAGYLWEISIDGKKALGYSLEFTFPMVSMNWVKEKSYEHFYFDAKTK